MVIPCTCGLFLYALRNTNNLTGVIHPLLKAKDLLLMAYHHREGVIEEGNELVEGAVPLDQLQPRIRLEAII